MKILLIEDEIKTANYISKGLKASGYVVEVAQDGEEGVYLLKQQHYELVILDIMLPKLDGWAIITIITSMSSEIRILFLSARRDLEDRVKGLNLGADDYLPKPFAFSELLARVRSLLRRATKRSASSLILNDLVIDHAKHKVTRDGQAISLTPKEFALLNFLVENKGQVLSRILIAEQVWGINFESDTNTIDVAMRRLRQKIDGSFEKKLLHTVHGIGYVAEER